MAKQEDADLYYELEMLVSTGAGVGTAAFLGYNMESEINVSKMEATEGDSSFESGTITNRVPDNNYTKKYIFRNAQGHIPDTPENRALLIQSIIPQQSWGERNKRNF